MGPLVPHGFPVGSPWVSVLSLLPRCPCGSSSSPPRCSCGLGAGLGLGTGRPLPRPSSPPAGPRGWANPKFGSSFFFYLERKKLKSQEAPRRYPAGTPQVPRRYPTGARRYPAGTPQVPQNHLFYKDFGPPQVPAGTPRVPAGTPQVPRRYLQVPAGRFFDFLLPHRKCCKDHGGEFVFISLCGSRKSCTTDPQKPSMIFAGPWFKKLFRVLWRPQRNPGDHRNQFCNSPRGVLQSLGINQKLSVVQDFRNPRRGCF